MLELEGVLISVLLLNEAISVVGGVDSDVGARTGAEEVVEASDTMWDAVAVVGRDVGALVEEVNETCVFEIEELWVLDAGILTPVVSPRPSGPSPVEGIRAPSWAHTRRRGRLSKQTTRVDSMARISTTQPQVDNSSGEVIAIQHMVLKDKPH